MPEGGALHRAPDTAVAPSVRERRRTGLLVTLVLGGLTATPPLSMDMYLPALPEVTRSLHASASTVQLTLTACLAGMALGQLVVGPMSDRWGRRRPLLAGLAVYVVATVLCALAPTVEALVGFRLVQGLAGAAGIVIARAVVRDLYDGVAMARFFSTLMLISGVAPVVAPLIGAQILRGTDWRGVFVLLAAVGLLLATLVWTRLPETLPAAERHVGGVGEALRSMRRLLSDPPFTGYLLTGGVMNPARAFGPQLVANNWGDDWWIWYVGPFAGGVIAAVLYELLYLRSSEPVGLVEQAEAGGPLEPDEPGIVGPEETVVVEIDETVEAPRWPAEPDPPRTDADR